MIEPYACFYVEKGEPYRAGTRLDLSDELTLVGRAAHDTVPDIAFASAFVSRQHFSIVRADGKVYITDLGSKHGTEIGGRRLTPRESVPLRTSERISLARGMVVLHFVHIFAEQTLELEPYAATGRLELIKPFELDREQRQVVDNGRKIALSDKEWQLFLLLYERAGTLVTNERIKQTVWPERVSDGEGVPDVGFEELNSLVYRIRRKVGKARFPVNAVRGSGYILEEDAPYRPKA